MANKRLALVACKTDAEGPWTLAKGNETGLVIFPLNEGELIWLDVEGKDGSKANIAHRSAGTFSLSFQDFARYRVRKQVNGATETSPTTVEVTLNGSAKG